jgi:hypothetical protein
MIDIDIKVKPADKDGFIIHLEGEGQSIDLIRVPNNFDAMEMAKELRLELARQVMIMAFREMRKDADLKAATLKAAENMRDRMDSDIVEAVKPKPKRKPRAKKQTSK